ncbi:hypothetical protein [Variibacter gotjawalensis]|nr:hypothetical protein [Variibacter gotjawalensis]NIK47330.1 hypothetical protein [Variibacter gotjawalensis]
MRRRGRADRVWGAGWEELSPSDFLYPVSWETVDEDELLLYAASLAKAERNPTSPLGPAQYMRDAVSARVFYVSERFQLLHSDATSKRRRDALAEALAVGAFGRTMDPPNAVNRGRGLCQEWFEGDALAHPSTIVDPDVAYEFELVVLRSMSIACAEHRTTESSEDQKFAAQSFTHALLVSLHSGLNAAYIYPRFALRHQTLSFAAWLGWIDRGRSCFMPPFVAEYAVALLENDAPAAGEIESALLYQYAAKSRSAILRAAKRSLTGWGGTIVRPHRPWWSVRSGKLSAIVEDFVRAETRESYLSSHVIGMLPAEGARP